jgi:hypothetical protein
MIVFLLICSIVCNSINSVSFKPTTHLSVGQNNSNSPTQPASQLPEKIESENDLKHQNNFFFIQQLTAFIPLNSPELQGHSQFEALCFRGNISGVPLFLSTRSILI